MRLPEIPQLEAFRAVVVEGHFGRAAEALGIAQPTLSHRIRALEEAVGARLFERGRAGVRLTAAGVAYARRVDGLLDLLGKAGNEARSAGEGLGGRLVVACSGALSCTPLPDALDILLRERPDMAVELQTRGLADQLGALLDGELDVGCTFAAMPAVPVGVGWRDLRCEPLYAWVSAGHPLAGEGAVGLEALRAERWVTLSERAEVGLARSLDAASRRMDRPPVEAETLDAALGMVRRGHVVLVAPDTAIVPVDVVRLALRPALEATPRVLWREGTANPLVGRLLAVLGERRAA